MNVYYNEFDPSAARWLRGLIDKGLIPKGFVDERSIADVKPEDLRGYDQCHFFAGIAGWPYALDLAGWGDRPVWTGSCPCQPFSDAGKRKAQEDPRHLWPQWFRLIRECRPDCLFGEQVAGAIGKGWLDGVCADLEAEGYAVGSVVLGAHSVGAPHIRQRLYWMADANKGRCERARVHLLTGGSLTDVPRPAGPSGPDGLADAKGRGQRTDGGTSGLPRHANECVKVGGLADPIGNLRKPWRPTGEPREGVRKAKGGPHAELGRRGDIGGLGNAQCGGLETWRQKGEWSGPIVPSSTYSDSGLDNATGARLPECERQPGASGGSPGANPRQDADRAGPWDDFDLTPCRDGKVRRTKSGVCCLADGIPGRVAQLRGLGNAIVPQVAAEFIAAYLEMDQYMGITKSLSEAVDDKKVTEAQADAFLAQAPKAETEKLIDKKGQGLLFAAGPVKIRRRKR